MKLKENMMQQPIYAASEEVELMSRLWAPGIKNNPLAFVTLCFPWGEKGTPLEHFQGPRRWQQGPDAVELRHGRPAEVVVHMAGSDETLTGNEREFDWDASMTRSSLCAMNSR